MSDLKFEISDLELQIDKFKNTLIKKHQISIEGKMKQINSQKIRNPKSEIPNRYV